MNKPYCWLLNGEVWFKEPKETDKEFDGYEITPLYAHQAELTDEEILQQAEWMFGTYFFESIDDPYWIEFARAILRKAQEK